MRKRAATANWAWTPIKPSLAHPNNHTLFALQPKSPKLSPPRTRVKVLGLTSSVKRVAHMVFKRDHSTVASSESPKLAAEDSDSKKLRASSPVQLPVSPARSSSPRSNEEGSGVLVPELPEFLMQERHSVTKKFKLLEARQRDRMVDGVKNGNNSPFFIDERDHITCRNRYANIYVWNSTRVKLGIDAADNDYINASHIALENPRSGVVKRYVATQGPKQDQARHLWLMALEQTAGPGVVVMLTKTFEMGREKCYEYFPVDMDQPTRRFDRPEPGETEPFIFEINLLEYTYDEDARTELRKVEIKVLEGTHTAEPDSEGFAPELKAGDSKIVWHMLFKGWPDWNVPEGNDSEALMKLIELANSKNEVAESPLIVHCSAGVGRSGTFIALDHLLTEIEHGTYDIENGDPIFDLVDRLREQRMYMVQSEPQYEYLYKIVREKLESRLGVPPGSRFLSPASTPGGMRTPSIKTASRRPSLEPISAK
ncbi:hypothetical protein H072_1386 [Dactylellina haptotyla CBS 200.50]|uniref:Protein-tyrosine-phosphatase n=1 Tax=Dactylellina haptotyla (strain CBS 200.50) TaxID=1284197 RepID=S8AP08_DACHA|nr:hypothetical protein H072_1386 [Dactylellina haptotyla CBS 200.50]